MGSLESQLANRNTTIAGNEIIYKEEMENLESERVSMSNTNNKHALELARLRAQASAMIPVEDSNAKVEFERQAREDQAQQSKVDLDTIQVELSEQVAQTTKLNSQLTEERESFRAQIEELNTQVKAFSDSAGTASIELEAAKPTIQLQAGEINTYTEKVSQGDTANQRQASEIVRLRSTVTQEKKSSEDRIHQLQADLATARKDLTHLQDIEGRLESQIHLTATANTNLSRVDTALKKQLAATTDLQNQLSNQTTAAREAQENLTKERQTFEASLLKIQSERDEASSARLKAIDKAENLETELGILKGTELQHDKNVKHLRANVTKLEQDVEDEKKLLQHSKDDHARQVGELNATIANLEEAKGEATAAKATLSKDLSESTAEAKRLRGELQVSVGNLEQQVENAKQSEENSNKHHAQQVKQLKETVDDLNNANVALTTSLKDSSTKVKRLKNKAEKHDKDLTARSSRIKTLEDQSKKNKTTSDGEIKRLRCDFDGKSKSLKKSLFTIEMLTQVLPIIQTRTGKPLFEVFVRHEAVQLDDTTNIQLPLSIND